MADKTQRRDDGHAIHNRLKDPSEWKTAGDPPTDAMISHAETLAAELGEERPDFSSMSKGELGSWIDQHR